MTKRMTYAEVPDAVGSWGIEERISSILQQLEIERLTSTYPGVAAMKHTRAFFVASAALLPLLAHAGTEAPTGLGQAKTGFPPCDFSTRQMKGETLT